MSIRYRDRYRVPSARLPGWDYRQAGAYAVTICTQARNCCLGKISNDTVVLSPIGEIVAREWLRIPRLWPHITLDAWIIMPDHLHGILVLADSPSQAPAAVEGQVGRLASHSLGAIVGQFKANCTKWIWDRGWRDFAWQRRFYDQILGDTAALQAMQIYIQANPRRWQEKNASGSDVETPLATT
ncbi:MAG TPA: transposase [Thermoanaerobaculia bacterium]|nr:transposase [Thermoanaerobaculia bacterium]